MVSTNEKLVRETLPGIEVVWGHQEGFLGWMPVGPDGKPYPQLHHPTAYGFHTKQGCWDALADNITHSKKKDRKTLLVEIGNLTEAQALAIEDMLAVWVYLGEIGGSRWVDFYADGDGNFHPHIEVNGHKPGCLGDKEIQKERWVTGEYRIDFDEVAWGLRKQRGES